MASPSSRRREGRNAFIPGEDPQELCPYNSDFSKGDWMDGWEEAQIKHDSKEALRLRCQEKENDEFDSLKWECPWNCGSLCEANNKSCEKENCAPWHFRGLPD